MTLADQLTAPLHFRPVYQTVVWGGRRMERWRADLPPGEPIGESWEISQQPRGMSVVDEGELAGRSIEDLLREAGRELVGDCYDGGDFPLLIKLIDANDRLSVQVHPDDELAQRFGVGQRGKTECWFIIGDGGELFQGTKPGVDRERFAEAIEQGTVEDCINRYETGDGDFFFLPARTLHALGSNTLLYEIQQSCDCTFRVYDWGRVGLDGEPRPLHVAESLQTIDFADRGWGPVEADCEDHPLGGRVRRLVDCRYFSVEERRGVQLRGEDNGRCWVVICVAGEGSLCTDGGECDLAPMQSFLVPACAGAWTASGLDTRELRLLVAQPR